jgi:PTH1 family peptidyl-tRNA hydrolase
MFTDPEPTNFYLIAGLGNPGRDYRETRHNIGFMALDRLSSRLGQPFGKVQSQALVARADHSDRRLVLAKPQTYMNLSGQAVGGLARFYKIPPSHLIVVYDDVDLPFGALRIRPGGGSAGQKGMQSIIERLATENFPRMRLGIGRPHGRMDAAAYVLQPFSREEQAELPYILDRAVEALLIFVTDGLTRAMNLYNSTGLAEEK